MMAKTANLTVQKWGNSLAVRIPSSIARSAHVSLGTLVELTVQESNIIVRHVGEQKLSLNQRLAMFDPKKHAGEEMASAPIGVEKF